MITKLKKKLKEKLKESLDKNRILVKKVADALTSLSPDEDECHKVFLKENASELDEAKSNSRLFLTMNFHWNYLDPTLLDHLVVTFELVDVQPQMVKYKSELQEFRKKTPLTLFCETQKRRKIKLSNEIVAEFEWSKDVTLEAVEEFRQEWASHYKFHEFTMMLSNIKRGCFIIAWIVPEFVAEKMITMEVPSHIVQRYSMSKLIVGGTCIYPHTVSEPFCVSTHFYSLPQDTACARQNTPSPIPTVSDSLEVDSVTTTNNHETEQAVVSV